MAKTFISYARRDKADVDQLVAHLHLLGNSPWVDSSLRGGQQWWDEILRQIAACDVFIATVSRSALESSACQREFDWAEALHKPVLPVALEPLPKALPRRFSMRHIVDYSDSGARDRAALSLAGGIGALPAAPSLPRPLPKPPAAPLSYITDLVDLLYRNTSLNHEQQRHIVQRIGPALQSSDAEERQAGKDILRMLSSRSDLYADVDRTISQLTGRQPEQSHRPWEDRRADASPSHAVNAPVRSRNEHHSRASNVPKDPHRPKPHGGQPDSRRRGVFWAVAAAGAVLAATLTLTVLGLDQTEGGSGDVTDTTAVPPPGWYNGSDPGGGTAESTDPSSSPVTTPPTTDPIPVDPGIGPSGPDEPSIATDSGG
ncbi:toll/interleukin-1 receptor domain-containing protein [Mycobacterium sp. IS-1742]|uniref:toll/interleukin-1 receptor domain-containing protein n=1 Tax=Mycobacterium sp. IS-1742 TaxID=1772285 RepID=UPI000AB16913|nr:toll/interleukin-1 receptor domain-containing protein [Mycobacterium sp. IS-1742]